VALAETVEGTGAEPGRQVQGREDRAEIRPAWARAPGPTPTGRIGNRSSGRYRLPPGRPLWRWGAAGASEQRSGEQGPHLDRRSRYLVASARQLPFVGCTFDLAAAYNRLMDVGDGTLAVAEAARTTTDDEHFAACASQRRSDAGDFSGGGTRSSFEIRGSYPGRRWRHSRIYKGRSLVMTLDGWGSTLRATPAPWRAVASAAKGSANPFLRWLGTLAEIGHPTSPCSPPSGSGPGADRAAATPGSP